MTEQELIDEMVSLTATARSIMQQMQTYGTVNQDVTFTAGGTNITVPSIPKQTATLATQLEIDRLAFHKDFGGAVESLSLTRDAAFRITGCMVTFASGWTMTHTYTRNAANRIETIAVVIVDDAAVEQANFSKTVTYDASGRVASVA